MKLNRYATLRIAAEMQTSSTELFASPTQVTDGGFMVCTSGNCTVRINSKTYEVVKWDLVVVSPYTYVQILHTSEDFDCSIIAASIDFFSLLKVPNIGDYFITINTNPIISINEREVQDILEYKEILLAEEAKDQQPFYGKINESLLMLITYKILGFYTSRKPKTEITETRNNTIFNTFVNDLLLHAKVERKLEFYAQRQSITPSHLSRCIKAFTGKNASDILAQQVISSIKNELSDPSKSITDISDEFNFCTTSAFSQYFKHFTGISPREFRRTFF